MGGEGSEKKGKKLFTVDGKEVTTGQIFREKVNTAVRYMKQKLVPLQTISLSQIGSPGVMLAHRVSCWLTVCHVVPG